MNFRTIDDNFEYQMKSVFDSMQNDYINEQEDRGANGKTIQTFAEWLWKYKENFGEMVYSKFDEYAGIDESTESLNFTTSKK